jgi:hypothetical protein
MQTYTLYYKVGGRMRTTQVYGEYRMRSLMTTIHHKHKTSCLFVVGEEFNSTPS